jgi:molecular chaperone DnaK
MDYLIAEFKKDTGIDVAKDKMVIQRLKDAAEKAKIELSSKLETTVNLPFLTADASGPKHLNIKVTRAKLEQMIEDLVERRSRRPSAPSRTRARARATSTRWCSSAARRASRWCRSGEEVLRQGAAQGREPGRGRRDRRRRAGGCPLRRGEGHGPARRHPALARRRDARRRDDGDDPAQHDHPDPQEEIFSTADDNQGKVEVHVLQGERAEARYNRTLGRFHLEGIMPAPRGVPKIKVTFDIDANGILSRPRRRTRRRARTRRSPSPRARA